MTNLPTLTDIYDSDGCYLAVESPDQIQTVRPNLPVGLASPSMSTTTSRPNSLTIAQRYLKTQFAKAKDHLLDRLVMFYLPSAPHRTTTTTTTMRPTTTTTSKKPSPPVATCPKPNGLFPHPGDCRKYVNCWKGRPHIQNCAEGTLFSAGLGTCDHAYKVDCRGNIF